jgi:hypothetical protein
MASARAPRTVPWKQKEALATPAGTLPRLAPRVPQIPGPVEPQAPSLPCPGEAPEAPCSPQQAKLRARLDQATLDLSITLLDHPLKADLFNSTLVGFLAVLGVDPTR